MGRGRNATDGGGPRADLAARLGPGGADLLDGLSDDDIDALAAAVSAAAAREAAAAAASFDPALHVVPRLLRPAVKRVLGR